jgi:hypothetical protein
MPREKLCIAPPFKLQSLGKTPIAPFKFHNSVMWCPEMTRRHKHAARAQ